MQIDKTKLIKLLNLTRSENNNEAINAMRRANAMVPDWAALFDIEATRAHIRKKYAPTGMPDAPPVSRDAWTPSIDEMLDECLNEVKGSAAHFIESLAQQYHERGSLSPKQAEALANFWRKL